MRVVLGTAGFIVIGDTGSALVADSGEEAFYAWAFEPPVTLDVLASEGYEQWDRYGDTVVFFDGVRYTWTVRTLSVFINSTSSPRELPQAVLDEIVAASKATPFPVAEPEPADRCAFPALRPSYLPWPTEGEPIPAPTESYDEEIDRAQLSWRDPRVPYGEAGVALTVYMHSGLDGPEEATDIEIQGVAGQLHRLDESPDSVSLHWDLPTSTCSFLELVYVAPNLTKKEAVQELLRIGQSLS